MPAYNMHTVDHHIILYEMECNSAHLGIKVKQGWDRGRIDEKRI